MRWLHVPRFATFPSPASGFRRFSRGALDLALAAQKWHALYDASLERETSVCDGEHAPGLDRFIGIIGDNAT